MTPNKWPEINGSSWGEISYFTLVITGFLGVQLEQCILWQLCEILPELILRPVPYYSTNYPRLPPRAVQEYRANQFEPAFDSTHENHDYRPQPTHLSLNPHFLPEGLTNSETDKQTYRHIIVIFIYLDPHLVSG